VTSALQVDLQIAVWNSVATVYVAACSLLFPQTSQVTKALFFFHRHHEMKKGGLSASLKAYGRRMSVRGNVWMETEIQAEGGQVDVQVEVI